MEWSERFTRSVDYIEKHLTATIDYNTAAQLACCSAYHYQRMFSYIVGVPLGEYIRRRRMTLAAFELQAGDARVVDLALKYGYDSPTAFSRAFQAVHGVTPTAAREQGVSLRAYPRIVFHIALKGDVELDYKIIQQGAFRVVGVKRSFPMDVDQNFAAVPQFFMECTQNGDLERVVGLMNQEPVGVLGVSIGNFGSFEAGQTFDYMIAAATDKPVPEGMEEYTVPASSWAVFTAEGPMPKTVQELEKRIVTEWLPTSGYEYGNAPDIEVNYPPTPGSNSMRIDVWLPIVKRISP